MQKQSVTANQLCGCWKGADDTGLEVLPWEEQVLHLNLSHVVKRRRGEKGRARKKWFIYEVRDVGKRKARENRVLRLRTASLTFKCCLDSCGVVRGHVLPSSYLM